MLTAFWGKPINESEFIANIPFTDNPHKGFRGDIDGLFGGLSEYGIYAEPIVRFLDQKGFNTRLLAGGVTELKQEITRGHPVVTWVTYALHNSYPIKVEIDKLPVTLVPWEHAVVITGYDEQGVYVNGPADGSRTFFDWDGFTRSWGLFGNMAFTIWPQSEKTPPGETPGVSPYFYRTFLNMGGLQIFGLPVSGELNENGKIVQYFERTRMEYDPKGPDTQPTNFGFMGREFNATRMNEAAFQPVSDQDSSKYYVRETGHYISDYFKDYWQNNGDLIVFGFPISEEFTENGKIVQYFERASLEYNPADKSVRPGALGQALLTQKEALAVINQRILPALKFQTLF